MIWNAGPVKKPIAGLMPDWRRWRWRKEIGNRMKMRNDLRSEMFFLTASFWG